LASDDLFLLDLKDNIGIWNTVNISGKTPGKRYGHSLNYSKPILVLFGGNIGDTETNDCWVLDIQRVPISWTEVKCKGELPPARVYHGAALCSVGTAKGMIIVFGGRSRDKEALSDTWGLTRHRNNTYEWLRAPQKGLCHPTGRYQHTCLFLGSLLIVVGGKSDKGDESVPLQVYDMMKNEWSSFENIERFRHDAFVRQTDLYIYGGFSLKTPNVPTDSLLKLNLYTVFEKSSYLTSCLNEIST
jgi:protein phosphatase